MKNNYRLRYCVFVNFLLFLIILLVMLTYKDDNNYYLMYGPNDNLYVLSIVDRYILYCTGYISYKLITVKCRK